MLSDGDRDIAVNEARSYTCAMIFAALAEQRRLAVRVISLSTFIGALYGMAIACFIGGVSFATGLLQGAATGILIGSGVFLINTLSQYRRWRRQIRRIPFLLLVVGKGVLYLLLFAGAISGTVWLLYPQGNNILDWTTPYFLVSIAFSALLSIVFTFILEVRSIVGRSVFQNFLGGRYHRPISERRLFLFVDLNDSTRIAEEIGDLRYLEFLDDFLQDIAVAANACHGEIYKYVGDEVIVSWPFSSEAAANCVRSVMEMGRIVSANADEYRRNYGRVPAFCAGSHGGNVVAGELGGDRREIAYLGDTVNTAARILDHAKRDGNALVISDVVHEALDPEMARLFLPLGDVSLRGRRQRANLFALRPEAMNAEGPALAGGQDRSCEPGEGNTDGQGRERSVFPRRRYGYRTGRSRRFERS